MGLKVLVVGCGSIGRRHMRNLRALRPDAEFVAYRTSDRASDELTAEFGLKSVPELEDGLADRPDFVLIANPTSMHLPVALTAAQSERHLFIEKPVSNSMEGVDSLVNEVAQRHLIALVGFNMRFHPGVRRLRKLVSGGAIGRVIAARAEVGQYLPDWRPGTDYRTGYSARASLGGGVILDLIHEIDCVRWLLGEVSEVSCFAGRLSNLDIETEDVAEILLSFVSGPVASVHLDYVQRPPFRGCRLIGEEGSIVWDYLSNETRVYSAGGEVTQAFSDKTFQRNDMYLAEMKHFLACVDGSEEPAIGLAEGARVLAIALAARHAAYAHTVERV